jgi:predicted class III extradiol MEMO1 family dioxygenase
MAVYVFSAFSPQTTLTTNNQNLVHPSELITASPYYEPLPFYTAVSFVRKSPTAFFRKPSIIIVPHHLTGAAIIADLISAAAKFNYSQIVLIGPNHTENGSEKFWTLKANNNSESFLPPDHSLGNPKLFLNYYFVNPTIKYILIKHDATRREISAWTDQLVSAPPTDTLYIFSLDFSHYLPANTAAAKDQETLKLIFRNDLDRILELNNDFVDSPSGLALCLSLAKRLNTAPPQVIHHTNSGFLSGNFSSGTTSYFGMVFFPASD